MNYEDLMFSAMRDEMLKLSTVMKLADWVSRAQQRGMTPAQIESELLQRGMGGAADTAEAAAQHGMTPALRQRLRSQTQGRADPLQRRAARMQADVAPIEAMAAEANRGAAPGAERLGTVDVEGRKQVLQETRKDVRRSMSAKNAPHQVHGLQPTPVKPAVVPPPGAAAKIEEAVSHAAPVAAKVEQAAAHAAPTAAAKAPGLLARMRKSPTAKGALLGAGLAGLAGLGGLGYAAMRPGQQPATPVG